MTSMVVHMLRLMTQIVASVALVVAVLLLAGFATGTPSFLTDRGSNETLRIATTTSLDDSGLLAEILPDFEEQYEVRVELIAVGTGQAIVLGERGDVDAILVHAPDLEQEFVEQGYGIERVTFMTNPFIIVGLPEDPASVSDANSAADALARIADNEATFVSRGDDSGTHVKELEIWSSSGIAPDSSLNWYHPVGQGMGETLLTANEMEAYTLTDRATFVAIESEQVSALASLFGSPGNSGEGDPMLDNPYSMIPVDPDAHPNTQIDLALAFIEWMDSDSTRASISEYGADRYGESLFTLIEDS